MKHPLILSVAAFCGFVMSVSANAQQTSFADVINGSTAPASLKISDLTPDYKAMRLRSSGDASPGMMGGLGGIMMMGMAGGGQGSGQMMPAMFALSGLSDLVWTKGGTVTIAGHEFLVTYKLNAGIDPNSISGQVKLAANLTLSLVRTDTVTTIAPVADMTPDQLRKTLTSAGAAYDTAPIQTGLSSDDAVMAAILFPVFAQARTTAKETVAISNAKQIALAALMYSNDYDDQFPYVESTDQFKRVTAPYYKDPSIWKTDNPNGGGFRFAMNLAGVADTAIDSPATTPMLYETNAWPDGKRAVAYADGHVKRLTGEQWAALAPLLNRKFPRVAKYPIKS